MWSHFLREVEGRATVTFTFTARGRSAELEAHADPMALGLEGMMGLLEDRAKFKRLFTRQSGFAIFSMFLRAEDWQRLYEAWLEAAGLSDIKLRALHLALEHLEEVEADFLRVYGLDLHDWFAGRMSSRRVSSLVMDLAQRPETLFGAEIAQIVSPMSKAEWMIAQSVAANAESKKPHAFLKTHAQRDEERLEQEKRERMLARGLSA